MKYLCAARVNKYEFFRLRRCSSRITNKLAAMKPQAYCNLFYLLLPLVVDLLFCISLLRFFIFVLFVEYFGVTECLATAAAIFFYY